MATMTDDALASLVSSRKNASVSYLTSAFAQDRIEALKLYRGDPLGDEENGLSTVVSRDVMEAVESMLPSLMRPFISGDEIVRFDPVGDEDEDGAQQSTDYINYLFSKRNDGFKFIYDTQKDGLMMRLGVGKVVREEYTDTAQETYGGLNDLDLQALGMDDAVKIVSKKPGQAVSFDGSPLWDVKCIRSTTKAKICVYGVPPAQFIFEKHLAKLEDATFLGERLQKTIADLIDMGLDREACMDLSPGSDLADFDQERLELFRDEEVGDSGNTEQLTRLVWVSEVFIKCAYDGTNVAWRRVIIGGANDKLLLNEEADDHIYETWTPIPIPHKLVGMSITDLTRDLMLIKTALWRESLNNAYLTNRPQREVVEGQVNIDDLLTPRIGGIVRVKAPGMVREMVTPFTAGDSFQLIEYADTTREQRTGVTRYNQGMDANSLNKTATGITAIMSASQQRQELVARLYAEFLKRIFRKMLELVCKHPDDAEIKRLTGKDAVAIDPREWSTEYDMTVSVGLGTGDRTTEVQHLLQLIQMDQSIVQLQGGANGPIVTLENVYQKLKHLTAAMGMKGADKYYTDPDAPPDPNEPQKPDPAAEQQQAAAQQQQAAMQAHQAEMAQQASIATEKAQSDAATKIEIAHIQAAADIEIARIKADADTEMGVHKAIGAHVTAVATMPEPAGDTDSAKPASSGTGGQAIVDEAKQAVAHLMAHHIAEQALGSGGAPPAPVQDLSYADPMMAPQQPHLEGE